MRIARKLLAGQARLCARFDRLLDASYSLDGCADFTDSLVPSWISDGALVYDIGGGKNPTIEHSTKAHRNLRIVGLDIDATELARAPEGYYCRTIVADLARYSGAAEADMAICRSLLEHVADTKAALAAIATMLKPGGLALVFAPSRNAAYARLNMLLPRRAVRLLLRLVFSRAMIEQSAFPVFYDRCTPRQMRRAAEECGLAVAAGRCYFMSAYFSFCFPLYVLWRFWVIAARRLWGDEFAETFAFVLRKL